MEKDKRMNHNTRKRNSTTLQGGFSLIELMIVLAILTTVIAVVTQGIIQIQKNSASEVDQVGVAQESRQFMDQILRDLRQLGYPGLAMFDPTTLTSSTDCTLDSNVACTGPISFSSTAIQFEGDFDGSGVSEVFIQVVVPAGGSCPCTVQRGTVSKASYIGGGTPAYYTELDYVMSQNVFTAYKFDGTAYSSSTDPLTSIKNIGVTLYVRSPQPAATGTSITYPTTTMVSEARISN
jgi:prepilin-type N-terminal cleavage/methylation domain-containing protein